MKEKIKKEWKIEDLELGDFITRFDVKDGKRKDTICLVKNLARKHDGTPYITKCGNYIVHDVVHTSKQGWSNISTNGTWEVLKGSWVPSTKAEKALLLNLMESEGFLWDKSTKSLTRGFRTGQVLKDKNTGKLYLHRAKREGGNVAVDGSCAPNDGDFEEATIKEEKEFYIELNHNGYRLNSVTDKKGFVKKELVNLIEKHSELSDSEKILYNEFELLRPDMDDEERIKNVKMVCQKMLHNW